MRNRAYCSNCGDVIESKHRHDWQSCKCGAIFVDGGNDYFRRGGDIHFIRLDGEGRAVPEEYSGHTGHFA